MGWFEAYPSLLFLIIGPNIQAQPCSWDKKSDNTQTHVQSYYMGRKHNPDPAQCGQTLRASIVFF